jgi:hypothetical protein
MGSKQEIDGIAGLVHRAVQVLPLAAHLNIGLIQVVSR